MTKSNRTLQATSTAFYTGAVLLSLLLVVLLSACVGVAPTATIAPTATAGAPTDGTSPTGTTAPTDTTAPTATPAPTSTTAPTATTAALRTFTAAQLAVFNGLNGNPAYIAIDGKVYDVSAVPEWSGGKHHGYKAGLDLTAAFPHGTSILKGIPIVGTYVG